MTAEINAMNAAQRSRARDEERKQIATAGRFWLPTRPYTLIDAINRCAASTGSVRFARLSSDANYNGHRVRVYFNSYRDYWLCEHQWGERVVHARGGVEAALRAGVYEYNRGARGTSVHTSALTPDEAQLALSLGYVPHTEDGEAAWMAHWYTDRHALAGEAVGNERHGIVTTHHLIAATDGADYRMRCERDHLKQCGYRKIIEMAHADGRRAIVGADRLGSENASLSVWPSSGSYSERHTSTVRPVGEVRAMWRQLIAEGFTPASEV